MVMEGQWRGGLVPYGYRLEFLGRTNKKNQPVRDLVIDEDESTVVKEIYRLITAEGYGTNRVASYLNKKRHQDQTRNHPLARDQHSSDHRKPGLQRHPALRA